MKQKATKIIITSMVLLLVAMPAFADFVFCGKKAGSGTESTPCKFSDLFKLVFVTVNYLIAMAGIIAILFVVWGGVQMLTSAGDPTRIKNAKSTIWNAILGLIIVMLAFLIVSYVAGLLLPDAGVKPLDTLVCKYLNISSCN